MNLARGFGMEATNLLGAKRFLVAESGRAQPILIMFDDNKRTNELGRWKLADAVCRPSQATNHGFEVIVVGGEGFEADHLFFCTGQVKERDEWMIHLQLAASGFNPN